MKNIMKRRELNIGDIIQVGYNQVKVVRDEKVSCDACYFRPICAKDYEALEKMVEILQSTIEAKKYMLNKIKKTK